MTISTQNSSSPYASVNTTQKTQEQQVTQKQDEKMQEQQRQERDKNAQNLVAQTLGVGNSLDVTL